MSSLLLVAVAQLVEPQIVVLVVAGSSPVGHPIFFVVPSRRPPAGNRRPAPVLMVANNRPQL